MLKSFLLEHCITIAACYQPEKMIKFFRNIRRRIISGNRFSSPASLLGRYLVYAIGEIVLVVLGILIALKLNGINTNKINRQSEITYLTAISENIKEDIEDLQGRLRKDTVHLDSYTKLMLAFSDDRIKFDEDSLKFFMHNSAIINYFNPQNTVFEEMKSSGKLHLIRPDALRYGIMDYYNHSNKVVRSQEINNSTILRYRENSIDEKLDINSLIESQLPDRWCAEINPFDVSFFDKSISDPEVQEFARTLSLMKGGVWINHNWKKNLLANAIEVRVQIEGYLGGE